MGTATFDVVKYARNRGAGAGVVAGELVTSGAHTTTTSASNLTDGVAGGGSEVSLPVGVVLCIGGDEDMRVAFGGATATATFGHLIRADFPREIEVPAGGTVSIIDVA